MKLTLALFLSFTTVSQAQSVKEYLIPAGNNVSHFNRQINAGKEGRKVKIMFVKQGDAFQLTTIDSVSMVEISTWMNNDEIKFLEMNSFQFQATGLPKIKAQVPHAQPQTYLKLPSATGAAIWTVKNFDGSSTKCSATLLDLVIKDEKKKALKVRKDFYSHGKLLTDASVFEYYVASVGLWKIETVNGEIKQELIEQVHDKSIERLDY
jgi:hypothetical protein